MALIKCPECGSEVSDSAFKCPKCGKQLRKPKRSIFGKLCLWLFYLYNLLMVAWLGRRGGALFPKKQQPSQQMLNVPGQLSVPDSASP